MRWNHPKHGPVPPMDFIPLAEENGLILELGRWILETACHQTRAWQEATGPAGLTISVNLSGRQILDRDLVTDVRRILAESGLAPSDLTLEMTESVLVQDVERPSARSRRSRRSAFASPSTTSGPATRR